MESLFSNGYFWLAAAAALVVVLIYNAIIYRGNAAERAWAGVVTYERQKNKLIPGLRQIAEEYREFEDRVQTRITELRNALSQLRGDQIDPQAAEQANALMREVMQGLRVTVEAYPDLKANTVYQQLMQEMTRQQENIAAAIVLFNHTVEAHNNFIQTVPFNIVNALLARRKRIPAFYDAEADGGFDYTPGLRWRAGE